MRLANFGSLADGSRNHRRIVFLESPVCLAMSRSGTPSRKCIRRILANMLTVITPFSCLASKQAVEHVGQFSMQISSGSGSVLCAYQHQRGLWENQKAMASELGVSTAQVSKIL